MTNEKFEMITDKYFFDLGGRLEGSALIRLELAWLCIRIVGVVEGLVFFHNR